MALAAGFPVIVGYGRTDGPFRNIKTLMGPFGFSDGWLAGLRKGRQRKGPPKEGSCGFAC